MKYEIYHRSPIFFEWVLKGKHSDEELGKLLDWPAKFHKVGEIVADSLQEVFVKTQNDSRNGWVMEPDVIRSWEHSAVPDDKLVANPDFTRSTSVGDVIIGEDGKTFVVAAMGFSEISSDEVSPDESDEVDWESEETGEYDAGAVVISREGDEIGKTTGVSYGCLIESCKGHRLEVVWADGSKTYPCTEGMTVSTEGAYKID